MFARVKKSGLYQYLQIVQNHREGSKTKQPVVTTIGRMDQIQEKGEIENLVRSLTRFSEKVLLVLSGKSDVQADARKIGPALICERIWKELEIGKIIRRLLAERKFGFDVARAIFLTVLHRLFVSGSDRSCDHWPCFYPSRISLQPGRMRCWHPAGSWRGRKKYFKVNVVATTYHSFDYIHYFTSLFIICHGFPRIRPVICLMIGDFWRFFA